MLSILLLLLSQNPATLSAVPVATLGVSLPLGASCVTSAQCVSGSCLENVCADHIFSFLTSAWTECDGAAISAKGGTLTFTRAGSANCQKSDGTLVTLTNNQPKLEAGGFIQEPPYTQPLLKSEKFDEWTCVNVTVTANNATDPKGGSTADTLQSTVNGGYCESPQLHIQSTTGASMFVKTPSGTQSAAMQIYDVDAATARCTSTFTATTTWPLQNVRQNCGTTAGVPANWSTVRIYPGGTGGTGTVVAWGANTSPNDRGVKAYVATDALTVFNPNSTLSWQPAVSISSTGCASGSVTLGSTISESNNVMAEFGTGSADMVILNGAATGYLMYDSNAFISNATGSSILNRSSTWKAIWESNAKTIGVDGVMGSPTTFDGFAGSIPLVYFGGLRNGSGQGPTQQSNVKVGIKSTGCQ